MQSFRSSLAMTGRKHQGTPRTPPLRHAKASERGKQRKCVRYSIKQVEWTNLIDWCSALNDVSDSECAYESAVFLVLLAAEGLRQKTGRQTFDTGANLQYLNESHKFPSPF